MARNLPTYEIEGTQFVVDIEKDELRQVDRPENVIRFEQMEIRNTELSFFYDTDEKEISPIWEEGRTVEVVLPQRTKLDPVGMSEKYNCPLEDVMKKNDYEVIVDQELVNKRLSGFQPVIDIAGYPFYVNIRFRYLNPKDDPSTFIDLRQLHESRDGESYRFFYDPIERKTVDLDPQITEMPKGILVVEIPGDHKLDPVGVAREEGMGQAEMKDWLLRFPIQKELKAVIIPISETAVPKIIEANRAKTKIPGLSKGAKKAKIKRRRRM